MQEDVKTVGNMIPSVRMNTRVVDEMFGRERLMSNTGVVVDILEIFDPEDIVTILM